MTDFHDSARWGLIPAGADAALYHDGRFAATAADARRFGRVRWITVTGDYRHCGIIDYEAGEPDFAPARLRAFVAGRKAMNCRARVYCNRSTFPAAAEAVKGLPVEWWISTLDGDKLSAHWTAGLWAVQYAGGMTAQYDTSVLYGQW